MLLLMDKLFCPIFLSYFITLCNSRLWNPRSFGYIYELLVVHEHLISRSKSYPLYIAEECAGVLSCLLWCSYILQY